MIFEIHHGFGIGSLESARFPAAGLILAAAVMLFMGFVPWARRALQLCLCCCSSAAGSRGWMAAVRSYYGALVVAERTWRLVSVWNCAHNVGGGIPPLLFCWGWPGSMTGTRRSICPLSVHSGGTVRLCDDARYPAILWLPPIEEYKNDYPDDYNEKAERS